MLFFRVGKSLLRALFLLLVTLWLVIGNARVAGANTVGDEVRSWLVNARSSIDVSTRLFYADDQISGAQVLGFDYFNVFSTDRGDVGTLIFQPYLVLSNDTQGSDDNPLTTGVSPEKTGNGLQWRIANFNYTGIGRGRFNLRVGHFELPFGLEQIVQTNGTLNQTNVLANTGLKTDWGASLNGELPGFEYELGFMRGSGNGLNSEANGYFVGRVGLPRYRSWWLGVSGISGELEFKDELIDLNSVAVDGGVRLPSGLQLMLEYSTQESNAGTNSYLFGELGYTSRSEAVFSYLQWRTGNLLDISGSYNLPRASLGVRYEPSNLWSASMEYQRLASAAGSEQSFVLQLRFRS